MFESHIENRVISRLHESETHEVRIKFIGRLVERSGVGTLGCRVG